MAARNRRVAVGVLALLLGVGALGGCTASREESGASSAEVAAPQMGAPAPPDVAADRVGGSAGGSGAATGSAGRPGVPVGAVQRALVRTAQVSLQVADTDAALNGVRAAAVGAGGFVAEERSGGSSGYVVLRVPAEALDGVVERVVGLAEPGTPVERDASVVDATEEVVDLDARVRSQQASVDRVRGLLAQASSIGDVIAIESELAQREAELDSLTARLGALRDQVALSTLTVSLDGPDDAGPLPAEVPPVGFLDGLTAGWEGLLALGRGTGAVLGFLLPFVPVLALLGAAIVALRRLMRGRRRIPPATETG